MGRSRAESGPSRCYGRCRPSGLAPITTVAERGASSQTSKSEGSSIAGRSAVSGVGLDEVPRRARQGRRGPGPRQGRGRGGREGARGKRLVLTTAATA